MSERLRARLNLINLSAAYKRCFLDESGQLTKDGERVLRDLADFGHMKRSTVKASPVTRQIDTHASMVAAGRREVVQRVLDYIHIDPTTHPLMKDEPTYE